MKKCLFSLIYFVSACKAEHFIYPVAHDGNQIMVLHQQALDNVELWIVDTQTNYATKGLSSFLVPANLRLMPSGIGFSFIDQGYIKIKEFAKRSAKTLPIYEPIGLFSCMNWIDDQTFYFVAREGDFFQIFQGDLHAHIQRLTYAPVDALYPQKIGDQLFYMKRDSDFAIEIVQTAWNPVSMSTNQQLSETVIATDIVGQACFLRMINDHTGFYIQAPTKKSKQNQNCYEFSCHALTQLQDATWSTEQLFSFTIPCKYLVGSTRLYESLEPFLPNYSKENVVYFVNFAQDTQSFTICKFNMMTRTIEVVSDQIQHKNYTGAQFFAPYILNETIFCGCIFDNEQHTKAMQENLETNFSLPFFKHK